MSLKHKIHKDAITKIMICSMIRSLEKFDNKFNHMRLEDIKELTKTMLFAKKQFKNKELVFNKFWELDTVIRDEIPANIYNYFSHYE